MVKIMVFVRVFALIICAKKKPSLLCIHVLYFFYVLLCVQTVQ